MIRNAADPSKEKYLQLCSNNKSYNIFCRTIEVSHNYKYLGNVDQYYKKKTYRTPNKNRKKVNYSIEGISPNKRQTSLWYVYYMHVYTALPKLKYCGELCFRDNLANLNQIQYQFYKRFCHLKITTPSYYLILGVGAIVAAFLR